MKAGKNRVAVVDFIVDNIPNEFIDEFTVFNHEDIGHWSMKQEQNLIENTFNRLDKVEIQGFIDEHFKTS